MAIKRRTKVEPAFSMSSMTDIVFLLLIFFLVSSGPTPTTSTEIPRPYPSQM